MDKYLNHREGVAAQPVGVGRSCGNETDAEASCDRVDAVGKRDNRPDDPFGESIARVSGQIMLPHGRGNGVTLPVHSRVVAPDDALQTEAIHPAICDPNYGIKACGQATERARQDLMLGLRQLQDVGAQAIVLGCTEIPLAIQEERIDDLIIIDPALILARALITAVDPTKLKK